MVNDPIADLLTRVRNGYMAGLAQVRVPHSEMKYSIAKIIEKAGFAQAISMDKNEKGFKEIVITLQDHPANVPLPTLKRISRPGRRHYVKAEEIRPVHNGHGIGIISTSKGLMSSYEAKHAGLGGEYLCEIY